MPEKAWATVKEAKADTQAVSEGANLTALEAGHRVLACDAYIILVTCQEQGDGGGTGNSQGG